MSDYMNLPEDFYRTLSKIERFGILDEDADQIHARMEDAVKGVASVEAPRELGVVDWTSSFLSTCKASIHQEICDPEKGELKEAYIGLIDKSLTAEGIGAIASVVAKVIAIANPACAVTSVILYLTIWLIKVGLNYWCSQAATAPA